MKIEGGGDHSFVVDTFAEEEGVHLLVGVKETGSPWECGDVEVVFGWFAFRGVYCWFETAVVYYYVWWFYDRRVGLTFYHTIPLHHP